MARSPLRRRLRNYALVPPQPLEDRAVPAIFVVTSSADDGLGSFREAIDLANADPDFDEIHFNLASTTPIVLASGGLLVDFPVLIDGYTQSGSRPNTDPVGTNALLPVQITSDSPGQGVGLTLRGSDITVRGLAISNFADGIRIIGQGDASPTNLVIAGNALTHNAASGILVSEYSGLTIGGPDVADRNLISSNGASGIRVEYSTRPQDPSPAPSADLHIRNNLIGTDATGNGVPGTLQGAGIQVSDITTGPGVAGVGTLIEGNVISGHIGEGILIEAGASGNRAATTGTAIRGNRIGAQAGSDAPLGNGGPGIRIANQRTDFLIGGGAGQGNFIGYNGTAGLLLEDSEGSVIQGNAIESNGGYGVRLDRSGGNHVEANEIGSNAFSGIRANDARGNSIQGNAIRGNGATGASVAIDRTGIYLFNSPESIVRDNSIADNGTAGISLDSDRGSIIQGNTVTRNGTRGQYPAAGIYASSSRATTIEGNTVTDHANIGILFSAGSDNTIENNVVARNGLYGLRLDYSSRNAIRGNTVVRNSAEGIFSDFDLAGIYLIGSDDNIVANNNVSNQQFSGIRLLESGRNVIRGNEIAGNGAAYTDSFTMAGVYLFSSPESIVSDNVIDDNYQDGMFVINSPRGAIQGNTITNNRGGIYMAADQSSMIRGNTLTANRGSGIALMNSAGTHILDNIIAQAGPVFSEGPKGIWLQSSRMNTIRGNTLIGNRSNVLRHAGIELSNSSGSNLIWENDISDFWDGVTIEASAENTVLENVIRDNIAAGVSVVSVSVGNTISRNRIFNNGDLGIVINTPIYPPLITQQPEFISFRNAGQQIEVRGILPETLAGVDYRLEFFRNAVPDPSGFGEGETFLASFSIDGQAGSTPFSLILPFDVPADFFLTATTTNMDTGTTSGFSEAVQAIPADPLVVANTNDDGRGSLRRAIELANLIPGANTIIFAIPGPGPHTIALASALPGIDDVTFIDGSTQPGFAGTPIVAVEGPGTAGGASPFSGFVLNAQGSGIRSLAIGSFGGFGVVLQGSGGHSLTGNFIGTDAGGMGLRPNGAGGVFVNNSASNLIESNLISGNGVGIDAAGVDVRGPGAVNNAIRGNTIGLARDGESILGNAAYGVYVGYGAAGTLIDSNTISGNGAATGGAGVYLAGRDEAGGPLPLPASGHQVINNRIGTNAAGTRDATGAAFGVVIDDLPYNFVSNNTISGHAYAGLLIRNTRARGNVAVFNRIGTDATARYAIPNGTSYNGLMVGDGVELMNAPENRIGGDGQGNIIAGNGRYGVYLSGSGSASNLVDLNLFGRGVDGSRIPNGAGNIARQAPTPFGPRIIVDKPPMRRRGPAPRPQPPRRPAVVKSRRAFLEEQHSPGHLAGRS